MELIWLPTDFRIPKERPSTHELLAQRRPIPPMRNPLVRLPYNNQHVSKANCNPQGFVSATSTLVDDSAGWCPPIPPWCLCSVGHFRSNQA